MSTPPQLSSKGGAPGGSTFTPFESPILLVCAKILRQIVSWPWVKLQAVKGGLSNWKSRFFPLAVFVQRGTKWVPNAAKFSEHVEKTLLKRSRRKNWNNINKFQKYGIIRWLTPIFWCFLAFNPLKHPQPTPPSGMTYTVRTSRFRRLFWKKNLIPI